MADDRLKSSLFRGTRFGLVTMASSGVEHHKAAFMRRTVSRLVFSMNIRLARCSPLRDGQAALIFHIPQFLISRPVEDHTPLSEHDTTRLRGPREEFVGRPNTAAPL